MSLLSNKIIVNLFYTRAGPTDKMWKWQCGTSHTQNDTDFSNIMQLLEMKHPAKLRIARNNYTTEHQKMLRKQLYCVMVISIDGWLRNVFHCLCPFAAIQGEDVQTHIRYELVYLYSFKFYMSVLTSRVKGKISNYLLHRPALVLAAQTALEVHHMAVFERFPHHSAHG